MFNLTKQLRCAFLLASLIYVNTSHADTWDLPAVLNDSNTTVSFVAESTWHTVNGTTKEVSGSITAKDRKDPLALEVSLKIIVDNLNTNWESRDEKLRTCMDAKTFPFVSFVSTRLSESCTPRLIDIAGRCTGFLTGTLTIKDVSQEVKLPVEIIKHSASYSITGAFPIAWGDFHVEDPSILIAKLDPIVNITYRTEIPLKH